MDLLNKSYIKTRKAVFLGKGDFMVRMFKMKEIKVVAENKADMLARVTSPIADSRVNIGAFCSFEKGNKTEFYFITADNERAREHLEKSGFKTSERDVVVLETANESGILFHAAQQLARARVEIEYAYSTAGNFGTTWIIFATKTIEKAMNVIP